MFQNDQKNIPSAGKTDTIHLTCIRCPLGCAISVRLENLRVPENCGIPKERRLPGDCGIPKERRLPGTAAPAGKNTPEKKLPIRSGL